MAKTVAITAADLSPTKPRQQSITRQRGVTSSAELVPLQFRMPQISCDPSSKRLSIEA